MAKKPKFAVDEVFILSECLPYEGSSMLGVFTSPEAAMRGRVPSWVPDPDKAKWTKMDVNGEVFWTTNPNPLGGQPPHEPWLQIEGHRVQS